MTLMDSDYKVQNVLGEGTFSRVFEIQHKVTGEKFAAKFLKNITFTSKVDIINCQEINVMKRIEDHPNILNLRDLICNTFPCNIILVFELMDMNLYEFLRNKQRPLSESIARTFFHQIVCGINHLHINGIFHRDVKPENILLKFSKTVGGKAQEKTQTLLKLADFGSVKSIEHEYPLTEYVATRWYRPPECILTNGYYGPKMDVWAAGCIFYEMLTLAPIFPGESSLDQLHVIHKILGDPSPTTLKRFRHLKHKFTFPKAKPIRFSALIPNLSKLGLNILSECLTYLPDIRIDSTRLKDHYYFIDERHSIPKSARRYCTPEISAKVTSISCCKLIKTSGTSCKKPIKKRLEVDKSNKSDKIQTIQSKRTRKVT